MSDRQHVFFAETEFIIFEAGNSFGTALDPKFLGGVFDNPVLNVMFGVSPANNSMSSFPVIGSSLMDTLISGTTSHSSTTRLSFDLLGLSLDIDQMISTNTCGTPLPWLVQSDYQSAYSIVLLLSPELSGLTCDYIGSYTMPNLAYATSSEFSGFVDTVQLFIFGATTLTTLLVGALVTSSVYNFTFHLGMVRWSVYRSLVLDRSVIYTFSASKVVRFSFEAFIQTVAIALMLFSLNFVLYDEGLEELSDSMDEFSTELFITLIPYVCYKYATHYLPFLDPTERVGHSIKAVFGQVSRDLLSIVSVIMRYFILVLRVNVYDALDDFLDSYYIVFADFDEDEYLLEVIKTITRRYTSADNSVDA